VGATRLGRLPGASGRKALDQNKSWMEQRPREGCGGDTSRRATRLTTRGLGASGGGKLQTRHRSVTAMREAEVTLESPRFLQVRARVIP
jgi:hypothetical protein